ncbi:MAG: DUF3592 domain-containing protein [Betaproteobacteria bacterium]|nr:DUF3592 domain-containing protein [Betaproteobacteria bacterium]
MTLAEAAHDTILAALDGDRRSIFLLACLYLVLVCAYSAFHQNRISRWPGVRGRLISAGVRRFGGTAWAKTDQQYVPEALYEYQVDGRRYLGKRVSPWMMVASRNMRFLLNAQLRGVESDDEGHVTVYYDPRNPAKSFLIRTGWVSQLVTIAIAALPTALYIVRYH